MSEQPIPDCLGPRPVTARPAWHVPHGSWDTHFHALGPQLRFPYGAKRKYTPPDAPVEQCLRLHEALGFARGLGGAREHARVRQRGRPGCRGALRRPLCSRGPPGCVRLTRVVRRAARARRTRRALRLQPAARRLVGPDRIQSCGALHCALGWFVELHFDGADIARLQEWLEAIPVQVVIDHLGRVDPAGGVAQEPFQILLALLARGNFWIKLSGADRISRQGRAVCRCSAVGAGAGERPSRPLVVGNRLAAHGLLRCRQGAGGHRAGGCLGHLRSEAPEREAILVHNPLRLLALAA
jgi:hypothetical protein